MKMQMRVVVQIATAGRIGRLSDMAKRKTIEELFKNRHFEQKVISLRVPVPALQTIHVRSG
jgi:hypothetical protein